MARPETPQVAVDVLIRLVDYPGKVVLIERHNPPKGWAIPGGFVDIGERVEAAAIREAKEETGLDVVLVTLLGIYSDPARDPRGHTVTAVYVADAEGKPQADSDAKDIGLFDPVTPGVPLAFDHRMVLDDYLDYLATGRPTPLRP
jgi:8-oxo-dGTP diphosphatase